MELETQEVEKSIWKKNQAELTVSESSMLAAGAIVVGTIAPVLLVLGVGGAVHLWETHQKRRTVKKVEKNSNDIIDAVVVG